MALQPAKLLANISSDKIVVAILAKPSLAFLALLVVEALRSSLLQLMMPFNERPEPGLPEDIRQAGVAMQIVIRLDQAAALRGQAVRQKPEVRALGPVDHNSITDIRCDI
ncbi:MAG: hypothetical protein WDN50_14360 [Bradyrhizobium sp.]